MPLPVNFNTGHINFRAETLSGDIVAPMSGSVSFNADVPWIVDASVLTAFYPLTRTVLLDSNGALSVDLAAGGDTDITPTGWTYKVVENFTGGRPPYHILVNPGDVIDLSLVVSVDPSTGQVQIVGPAGGGINWRGAWSSGATYVQDDGVYYNTSTYRAATNIASGGAAPSPTLTSPWFPIALSPSVSPTFTGTVTLPNAVFGTNAHAMVLSDTLGTNGRRLHLGPLDEAGGTSCAQFEIVPGSAVDTAHNVTSQILLYNTSGANYERFGFTCVNNQYIISSTFNGAGVSRNLYFQMGGSVSNNIASRNAMECGSDASMILNGSNFVADGKTWGLRRTTVGDFGDTGHSGLNIDTRITTPADDNTDSSWLDLKRGGVSKWKLGLNYSNNHIDSLDFIASGSRVLSLYQTGSIGFCVSGGSIDTLLTRGAAAGRVTLTGATDVRVGINSTTGATTDVAVIDFQRGGASKWIVGNNYAQAGADSLDFHTVGGAGLALQLTATRSVVIGKTAPATTATDGFPYVPVCAGTPTGTPTTKTGFVPMVVDSTGVKVWFYIGGTWKGVVVA